MRERNEFDFKHRWMSLHDENEGIAQVDAWNGLVCSTAHCPSIFPVCVSCAEHVCSTRLIYSPLRYFGHFLTMFNVLADEPVCSCHIDKGCRIDKVRWTGLASIGLRLVTSLCLVLCYTSWGLCNIVRAGVLKQPLLLRSVNIIALDVVRLQDRLITKFVTT